MACTEAYKEHIMYTFNGFCKVVIRYAAINAWRERSRRRQREISFEYLTEEKFYSLNTSDNPFTAHYEEHPVTICGQTIILTNGELAAALLSLPEKEKEIIYLYFFGSYTQQEMGKMYRRARSTMSRHLQYITDSNRTWKQIIQRQVNKGLTGDSIYKFMIQSSQRSRTSVNKSLGLE